MMIASIKYFMIISGAWDLEWTENRTLRTAQFWYRRINKIGSFLCVTLTIAKLIQLILIGADSEPIFACLAICLTIGGLTIKTLLFEKNGVSVIFQEIINEEKKIAAATDGKIIQAYKKKVKICTILRDIFVILLSIVVAILFLLKSALYLMKYGAGYEGDDISILQDSMLLPMWFPVKENENVVLVLIVNIIIVACNFNVYVGNEITTIIPMLFVTAQLDILRIFVRNLDESHHGTYYKNWKEIIIKHMCVIRFVKAINKYTKYVMLTNFLILSVNIASLSIEILMNNNITELIYPLGYLLVLLATVFFLAWFANEIMIQNHAIGEALYQTRWYNQDVNIQKLIPIIIQQAHLPLTLSIGAFGPMTLGTALTIMRAAYSYITLMRNLK